MAAKKPTKRLKKGKKLEPTRPLGQPPTAFPKYPTP
jgi:hypothetical protein